jgi:hypothetical protein
MGPLCDRSRMPVLHWVVVYVIRVSFEIVFIADDVFPEAALSDAALSFLLPAL